MTKPKDILENGRLYMRTFDNGGWPLTSGQLEAMGQWAVTNWDAISQGLEKLGESNEPE